MKDGIQLGLLNKISKIIDELKIEYDIFEDVNKEKNLRIISKIIDETTCDLYKLSYKELKKRIRNILAFDIFIDILMFLKQKGGFYANTE